MKKRFLSAFLALALCLGLCAVPASAEDRLAPLSTDLANLMIYDMEDGEYRLGDQAADVTVLVIGRISCSNTVSWLQRVSNELINQGISNGRAYLLVIDQEDEESVRRYIELKKPWGTHVAWSQNAPEYKNLCLEIARLVESGNVTYPAVCVLDRELQPVYYNAYGCSPDTGELVSVIARFAGNPDPSQPTIPSRPSDENVQTSAAETQRIYEAMVALKAQYPEGTPWTGDNCYAWNGGGFKSGYGGDAFAYMLSDAAFDKIHSRQYFEFEYSDVKVGDILRIDGDRNTVIVLEVHDDHIVVADGNYSGSGRVHWGRELPASKVKSADYLITRYPEDIPESSFTDVPEWCKDAVSWAVYKGITMGTGDNQFNPGKQCTNAEILTFLWRNAGEPDPYTKSPINVKDDVYFAKAVHCAYLAGMIDWGFDVAAPCTRLSALTYIWAMADGKFDAPDASFSDTGGLGPKERAAVNWAVQNGITAGTGDGTFSPGKVCTRGEIVTFLYRAYVPTARLG